jgi:hypothetical protein
MAAQTVRNIAKLIIPSAGAGYEKAAQNLGGKKADA